MGEGAGQVSGNPRQWKKKYSACTSNFYQVVLQNAHVKEVVEDSDPLSPLIKQGCDLGMFSK